MSNQLFPAPDQKLLVLQVAIKNNTPADNWFNASQHQFQIQDNNNQLYTGGNYRLTSTKNQDVSLNLKPGQGAGQDPLNRLEVAIPIADSAKVSKIILQKGRQGSSEDVMRFMVAGTQDGDAGNVIAPLKVAVSPTPIKAEGYFPSASFQFRINGVSFAAGPLAGSTAPENRRFAIVNLSVKNMTSATVGNYDFIGNWWDKLFMTDADGEKYPAFVELGLLKGLADEPANSDFPPGQEKTLRVAFPVPLTGALKSLSFGATGGKQWLFDASDWK